MRNIITKTFGQVQYSTKTATDCHDTLGFLGQYKYHATLLSIHHMTSYHHMLFIVHQYHQCTVLYVIQTILILAGNLVCLSPHVWLGTCSIKALAELARVASDNKQELS